MSQIKGNTMFKPVEQGQKFITYYKKNGHKVLLPSDPYSLELYTRKGFTLTPPEKTEVELPKPARHYDCDVCGKSFGHHLALAGHKSSHKEK